MYFLMPNISAKFERRHTQCGHQMQPYAGGEVKIGDFRRGYNSETVLDRRIHVVYMKVE